MGWDWGVGVVGGTGGFSSASLIITAVMVDLELSTEFRSCVKVEVAVLGSPSLTVLIVSVDVKQH